MKSNRVAVVIVFCLLFSSVVKGIPWPVTPQNFAHPLNKTYGDWNGLQVDTLTTLGFHCGVDIPANAGTPVYAVIDGVVSKIREDPGGDQGLINISTDTLEALAWHYGHIHYNTALNEGDSVHVSDNLGVIAQFHNPDIGDHLHFQRSNNDYSQLTGYCNPLTYLSPSPSQAPHIDPRFGAPHHPYKIYYVQDKIEDITNSYETTYLRDSVDIIVKANTEVEVDPRCGVYAIGYGVEPLTTGGNIPFRKMFEMRNMIQFSDALKYYLTYADPADGSLSSHFQNWYIGTNCGSSEPQPGYGLSNIREDCWPTKVNTAGTADADSIEDAKFPDGYYVTTIKVWSHSGDSAVAIDTVCIGNFRPKVKETDPHDGETDVPIRKDIYVRFSEAMDTGQETRISGDQEEGYQDIRISGYQRIREFKNNNFQINTILNIDMKINRAFFEIICTLDRHYNIYTIKQEKIRYEGLAEVLPSEGLDAFCFNYLRYLF